MSVTELLLNFRDALLAIVPRAERVGIPWMRPHAYDEWDSIAAVLFENLVSKVIEWSLPPDLDTSFNLPAYDLALDSYAGSSTLEVVHSSLPPGHWIFHAFGTVDSPFDVIEVRQLSGTGTPITSDLQICPVQGAQFVLRFPRNPADSLTELDIATEFPH